MCKLSLVILVLYTNVVTLVQGDLSRKRKMIDFLVQHKELPVSNDNWNTYKDFMYESLIFKSRNPKSTYTIYLFGATSSHGKTYVALCSLNAINLLETEDLSKDMDGLLKYFKRFDKSITSAKILQLLEKINACYESNKKIYF